MNRGRDTRKLSDEEDDDDKPLEMSLKSSSFESKLLGIHQSKLQGRPLLRKKKESKNSKGQEKKNKELSQLATQKIQESLQRSLKRERAAASSMNSGSLFISGVKPSSKITNLDQKPQDKGISNGDFEVMVEHTRHQEHLKGKTKPLVLEERVLERDERKVNGFRVVYQNSGVLKESKKIGKKQEGFLRNSVYGNTRNIRAPLRTIFGRSKAY